MLRRRGLGLRPRAYDPRLGRSSLRYHRTWPQMCPRTSACPAPSPHQSSGATPTGCRPSARRSQSGRNESFRWHRGAPLPARTARAQCIGGKRKWVQASGPIRTMSPTASLPRRIRASTATPSRASRRSLCRGRRRTKAPPTASPWVAVQPPATRMTIAAACTRTAATRRGAPRPKTTWFTRRSERAPNGTAGEAA